MRRFERRRVHPGISKFLLHFCNKSAFRLIFRPTVTLTSCIFVKLGPQLGKAHDLLMTTAVPERRQCLPFLCGLQQIVKLGTFDGDSAVINHLLLDGVKVSSGLMSVILASERPHNTDRFRNRIHNISVLRSREPN